MSVSRAASVHARLRTSSLERGEDFNWTLTRYANERFLYRLSISSVRDRFWLKGALLFELWFTLPHRPTRDIDFLGFGPADTETLGAAVREICGVRADDAMTFDPDSVGIQEIREEARYAGLRVKLMGHLGKARCPIQIDVGYGDAVATGPVEVEYPTLLPDHAAPRLRAYPPAAMVAEKLEAIVSLGMANSRMKDFFDLHVLGRTGPPAEEALAEAIAATFARRATPFPDGLPLGLTEEFAQDPVKQSQWKAFLAKGRLTAPPLAEVIAELRRFLGGPLHLAAERTCR